MRELSSRQKLVIGLGIAAGGLMFFQNCAPARMHFDSMESVPTNGQVTKFQNENTPDDPRVTPPTPTPPPTAGPQPTPTPPVNQPPVDNPPPVAPICKTETFTQPVVERSNKVDILFVIDTSASLNTERQHVAAGLRDFVKALDRRIDYRVGVMLAHSSRSSYSGRLFKKSKALKIDKLVLTSENTLEENALELQHRLNSNCTNSSCSTRDLPEDSYSDGGEEGMFSLYLGLTDPQRLAEMKAAGFLRSDAALSVIMVSDENDICAKFPAGVTPVPDPNGLEIPAYRRDCADLTGKRIITEEAVLAAMKKVKGDQGVLVSSVVYTNPPEHPQGEDEKGYGYLDLTALAHGVAVDIKQGVAAIGDGLRRAGEETEKILNLNHEFKLSAPPTAVIDSVKVDGKGLTAAQYTYTSATQILYIPDPGGPGSKIEARYCVRP